MSHAHPHLARPRREFHVRPTTALGVRSVRLVGAGVLVTLSFSALTATTGLSVAPYFVLAGVLAILVGGAMAMFSIVKRGERSVAAIATTPFWAIATVVFVGELAQLLVWLL